MRVINPNDSRLREMLRDQALLNSPSNVVEEAAGSRHEEVEREKLDAGMASPSEVHVASFGEKERGVDTMFETVLQSAFTIKYKTEAAVILCCRRLSAVGL